MVVWTDGPEAGSPAAAAAGPETLCHIECRLAPAGGGEPLELTRYCAVYRQLAATVDDFFARMRQHRFQCVYSFSGSVAGAVGWAPFHALWDAAADLPAPPPPPPPAAAAADDAVLREMSELGLPGVDELLASASAGDPGCCGPPPDLLLAEAGGEGPLVLAAPPPASPAARGRAGRAPAGGRRKEKRLQKKDIEIQRVAPYFHLPMHAAAKRLGICSTVLKKICRRHGLQRWPYRKLKCIDKILGNLQAEADLGDGDGDGAPIQAILDQIEILRDQRRRMLFGAELAVLDGGDGEVAAETAGEEEEEDEEEEDEEEDEEDEEEMEYAGEGSEAPSRALGRGPAVGGLAA